MGKRKVELKGYIGSKQEFHRKSTFKKGVTKSQKRGDPPRIKKMSDNIYYVNFGQFWRNRASLRAWVGGLVFGIIGVWLLFVFFSWVSYITEKMVGWKW